MSLDSQIIDTTTRRLTLYALRSCETVQSRSPNIKGCQKVDTTSPAQLSSDRGFALRFLIIGAIGILPALCLLVVLSSDAYHNNDTDPSMLLTLLLTYVMFIWGMTLFFGYIRALNAQHWPRRVMLWRATIAYNALLGPMSIRFVPNTSIIWFFGLAAFAYKALQKVQEDERKAQLPPTEPLDALFD
jgi:hypothetical protein